MLRFLIFLFPAMMDVIVGSVMFVTVVRFAESGADAVKVTATMAGWALAHSIFSVVAGKVVTPKNAAYIISASAVFIALTSLGYILVPGVEQQYIWIVLTGVGSGFFFCPFQVFMKEAENGEHAGIIRSTALYGFSWSCGLASGPFIAGFIWGKLFPVQGWKICHLINGGFGLLVAIGILIMHWYCQKHQTMTIESEEKIQTVDYSGMPDLAWLGWVIAGVGCITIAIVRTIFPYKSNIIGIPKADQGIILAIVSYSQGLSSLCFIKSRYWMYKSWPIAVFSLSGVAGLLLFAFGQAPASFYVAAILYGIYSGTFFFLLVFHSLVHPEKSAKYVAINEVVVGVTGIIAPIIGGWLADLTNSNVPFYFSAVLAAVVILAQLKVSKKISRNIPT
jgi:MFS family permease